MILSKETLNNSLRQRSAALGGAQKFACRYDRSHFLRSVRFASHLARSIMQRFPNSLDC